MVEITLVRHGQANTGATDEASYDRLSELGLQQAEWLGAHLAETGQGFDRILAGSLHRQQGTAAAIAGALGMTVETDPRLNEMDYFGLAASLRETHALDIPTDSAGFASHLPQVLQAWEDEKVHSELESYARFEARISAALADAEAAGGRVMLVTSGGVISTTVRMVLRLETEAFAHVMLQVRHTSMHRLVRPWDRLMLDGYNALPHLDRADRAHARTFI